jgi:tetratricopeptide (TPR) repeat protein
MFLYIIMILVCAWLIKGVRQGEIKPLFLPTPTPTRTAQSYALEGDAQFTAGQLDAAIAAYRSAVQVDSSNADVWAELARIQAYSSSLLTTDQEKIQRLQDALDSINQAVSIAPEDSKVRAIRSFVLDWNADPALIGSDKAQELLTEANQDAVRALQLDSTNALALAFYAEISVDQQNWTQGEQYIQQAVERGGDLMDVHRVYAYVLESLGQYNQAIQEYDKAIALAPNLTFLYIRAGANYRRLAFASTIDSQQEELYNRSLDYFAKAARINQQINVKDPTPYLSISKTYSQMGQYFSAALNVQKALEFKPADPDIYGQLGIVYFKSRNYEGSIPALKCAVRGCTPDESCQARFGGDSCNPDQGEDGVQVQGLPLSPSSVVYYYTYGSVLAALNRPQQNYCPEALNVLSEVKTSFGGDPTIRSIIQAGETICQSQGELSLPSKVTTPTTVPAPSTSTPAPPNPTPTPY